MAGNLPVSKLPVRIALTLVALSTVLFELILTRLFSASAGYHFAFMIVSMAMFGMTAGALYTYIKTPPDEQSLLRTLKSNSLCFAAAVPLACAIDPLLSDNIVAMGPFLWITLNFILYSLPFYFSGVVVSLCLSRFSDVGRLYATDLIGAALACPLLILGLSVTSPGKIIAVAGLMGVIASACFDAKGALTVKRDLVARILVVVIAALTAFLPEHVSARLGFGQVDTINWSPLGRVVASFYEGPPLTWAKLVTTDSSKPIPQKGLFIDAGAFTVMSSGPLTEARLMPLKRDITALGNRLRPRRSLFVIGVGGGRDILTGLLFQQKRIDGVEVNPAIIRLLKEKYAQFNGHIAEQPEVHIFNDEARNWLARSNRQYGIIQCSLVDTFAASSSGAFMLNENVLYTREAFELYMRHLEKDGVLCFLRWGDEQTPTEVLRMLSLGKAGLNSIGVFETGPNMMLINAPYRGGGCSIGAMLVSPTPFSASDIDQLQQTCVDEGYKPLWLPGRVHEEPFASSITATGTQHGLPRDDSPFFFTPSVSDWRKPPEGVALLWYTLLLSSILASVVIVFPAFRAMHGKLRSVPGIACSGLFFGSIGIAFMLVEVGQVQRLTILLGNPTYGLSVVLFALLLSSGFGSYVAQRLVERYGRERQLLMAAMIVSAALLALTAWLFGNWLPQLESNQLAERMAAAIPLVCLPGFTMGWAFPLGMTVFRQINSEAGPWYWAMNGAASVLGSILAAIISVMYGIQMTMLSAAGIYFLAFLGICALRPASSGLQNEVSAQESV